MTRVVLENITKRFGNDVAVDNLSLTIDSGEFVSFLGPSGCGKTTTMRMIAGLEVPDEGRIWIGDKLVSDAEKGVFLAPSKRQLGMVFQNYALWPHMTVGDNIRFGLKVRKLDQKEQDERVHNVLERLQIPDLADRYPSELSGGQQQRVALARELVTGAEVLLMDEPLSNLDAKLRIDMRVELKELHLSTGRTIIYVTHDQTEALTLSDNILVMKEGIVQQVGSPDEVFMRPENLFVASFMSSASINEFTGTWKNDRMTFDGFDFPAASPANDANVLHSVSLITRPDEMSFSKTETDWTVPGEVLSVFPQGYTALAHVRLELPGDVQSITLDFSRSDYTVARGDKVFVSFNPQRMHVFDQDSTKRLVPFPEQTLIT